jgi:hypothetical protein
VSLLFLVACQGDDGGSQTAPTTTTSPDPAVTACRETNMDIESRRSDAALQQLTLSRDSRIAAAATKVDSIIRERELDDEAPSADLDMEYDEAVLELARACKAAGHL